MTDHRRARVGAKDRQTPDTIDIMTIGCSYTWGHGVENDSTYASKLEEKTGLRVANFGMGGYGTVQSLLMLHRNLNTQPRIIIYGFLNVHITRNLSPCAPSHQPICLAVPYVAFNQEDDPYIHVPLLQNTARLSNQFYREVNLSGFHPDHALFRPEHLLWGPRIGLSRLISGYRMQQEMTHPGHRQRSLDFLLRNMVQAAERIRAHLVIVHIPLLYRNSSLEPPPELVRALASLNGRVTFLDMRPIIAEHYQNPANPDLFLANDGHPNELAHELIAEELTAFLKKQRLLR
jgi:hypothetical protein